MAAQSNCLTMPAPTMHTVAVSGFGLVILACLTVMAGVPASAQALRSPSANSVAAGATSDRTSMATPSTPGLPGATARQSVTTGTGGGSYSPVTILGMPLRFAAPVTAPYDSTGGTGTFAGQPMRGRDAVMQQSIDGAP